jgi:hypothetical protein
MEGDEDHRHHIKTEPVDEEIVESQSDQRTSDIQKEPYHLLETAQRTSVKTVASGDFSSHICGDFSSHICGDFSSQIKTEPCDALSIEKGTPPHVEANESSEESGYQKYQDSDEFSATKVTCKSVQVHAVKKEPADDCELDADSSLFCKFSSKMATGTPLGGDNGESEGGTDSMPPPGPVPVNLIPAARNKGLLKIEVDDPLHPVTSGMTDVEEEEAEKSSYDFDVGNNGNDVSSYSCFWFLLRH